jgi:hypothetical protein
VKFKTDENMEASAVLRERDSTAVQMAGYVAISSKCRSGRITRHSYRAPLNHHYRSAIKLALLGFGMAGSRRFQRPP